MIDLVRLGRNVARLRAEHQMSLQELASAASVSPSMLSAVERGLKAPTVTVLARIADGLRTSVGELVEESGRARVIVRRAANQDHSFEAGGWERTIVSPVVPGVNFEWICTSLPPHTDAGEFPAYAPGSHEYLFVQSGILSFTADGETYELGPGDSLYFAADVLHAYANRAATPCRYYVAALIMRARTPGGSKVTAGRERLEPLA